MNNKLFYTKLSFYAFFFLVFTASFSSVAQFNPNEQFTFENLSNRQRASIEFTSRLSIGCCGGQVVYDFDIQNGVRFEAETALAEFFSRETLTDFQKWRFINLDNGIVQIVNVRSGRAIDVANANAIPNQQDINASDRGQQWRVAQLGGNNVRFVSVLTGKALSINRDAIIVQRNVRRNNRAQMWRMESVEVSPLGDPDAVDPNLTIAPNPAINNTTLFIDSPSDDPNAFYVIRERGFIEVVRRNISLIKGSNEVQVDLSSVNEGLSVVIIFIDGEQRLAKNLIINR
ncbi:RICIN domain-containing protein [Aquimarina sp. RZ0]|uniref:RICIN domain-containing protein n=1 Tax=Aquimarina sp. RZ0 TaxID=2607730 RepID=UPI0011F0CC10|nr:RICIN domain-containing protein [Aquimarina sp. RZ0]KAA1245314.1 RICIN domain-containing protein [Aquimarina sp. RZ0]